MENSSTNLGESAPTPYLRIEFVTRSPLEFATRETLEAWLNEEAALWASLSGLVFPSPQIIPRRPPLRLPKSVEVFAECLAQLESVNETSSVEHRQSVLVSISSRICHCVDHERLFLGDSTQGIMIRQLAAQRPLAAFAAAGCLMTDAFDAVPEIQLADGVIRAYAFRERWPEAGRVAEADYESVKQRVQTQYDDKIKLIESREAQLLSMHEQSKAFLETVKGQFALSFDGAGEQLENIRKSYDERMALRAPVEYWTKKSKSHLKASWWLGGSLVLYLTGALFGLWELVQLWASKEVVSPELTEKRLFPQLPNYSLAFVLLVAFVAFWFGRILVRLVLSHLHLYFDSDQRVVMTQTYLALIREGSLTTENGRESVLRALFRPTATGIVRDDAVPPTPLGAAMRGAG